MFFSDIVMWCRLCRYNRSYTKTTYSVVKTLRAYIKHSTSTAPPPLTLQTMTDTDDTAEKSKAEVLNITKISPTVKLYNLKIHDTKFTFKSGQW